jgi:TrpR-related protein YerC/YecD
MSLDSIYVENLYKVLSQIDDASVLKEFLNDLCTYKEIEQMAQRLEAAKLLLENNTYEEVIKKTEISSATLSRVSKCVKYGQGYKKVLKND